jgi:hypothetical protein
MADLVDVLEVSRLTSLTRREFTLEAALAILAGCVITISDTACSSGMSSTTPTPTPVTPSDINGNVSANHGHVAVITGAQITAGTAIVALDIRGTATHTHTLSISQTDLTTLKNRQTITSDSTTDSGHSHTVTFTPA